MTLDGVTLHGYLLSKHKDELDAFLNRMIDAAEQMHLNSLNMWLSTGPMVRDNDIERIIRKYCPESEKILDGYKGGDYVSCVAWVMRSDLPDNEKLMSKH